ncbi:hypothetical protein BN2476_40058 [Paraburkholderia piptadeniae]|uniref:Uncharacterized protein n=1 Tax=Paraburkholderia piptadeniae TaxID=1701573 RepID=A0A1N7RK93_9BURK|nr:hypothetical protein BN2476_40058 [Paraburkholderia piptadeniae]
MQTVDQLVDALPLAHVVSRMQIAQPAHGAGSHFCLERLQLSCRETISRVGSVLPPLVAVRSTKV